MLRTWISCACASLLLACAGGDQGRDEESASTSTSASATAPGATLTSGDDRETESPTGTAEPTGSPMTCAAGELACDGVCVPCPTPGGTALHRCDEARGRCVVDTCRAGFERCALGCCAWEFEVIDGPPLTGPARGALALDPSSEPAVVYMDASDRLSLARRTGDGDWVEEVVATGTRCGDRAEIAFDGRGAVHLGLYDWGERRVEYLSDASGSWVEEIVDSAGPAQQVGIGLQLAIDGDGFAHLAYYATDPGRIVYATNREGAWIRESLGEAANTFIGLAVDAEGAAHVTHRDHAGLHLRRREGGLWDDEIIADEVAANRDLVIDGEGRIHALFNAGLGEVWTMVEGDRGWEKHLVDDKNGAAAGDLAVDVEGRANVVYCYSCGEPGASLRHDDLKIAWFDGGQWRSHIVYDEGYVTDARIAVDAQGLPQVVFLDNPIGLNDNNFSERALTWGRLVAAE